MRRLFGWALAPMMLAAAGTASAASLDIRNAALRVVVIPEARSDVSVTILKTNSRLPLKLTTGLSGQTIVDGGQWFAPFGQAIWCEGDGVHVWGVGHIANADLPQILVRMPLDARVSAGGGVFGAISRAERLDLAVSGCGDWTVGNVLAVGSSGSANVRTGTADQMALQASGSGDIVTRTALGGLDAAVSGSGEITVEQASGPVRIRGSGSGDLVVNGGQASRLDVDVSGSGDVQFKGAAQDLSAGLSGNGEIASDGSDTVTFSNVAPVTIKPAPKGFDQTSLMLMGAVTRSLGVDISGSGDMTVLAASGTVRARISGSGALKIAGGHASTVDARISGSGDVDFDGQADTVNASSSGSGNLRVARVTGAVVSSATGSGRVTLCT